MFAAQSHQGAGQEGICPPYEADASYTAPQGTIKVLEGQAKCPQGKGNPWGRLLGNLGSSTQVELHMFFLNASPDKRLASKAI